MEDRSLTGEDSLQIIQRMIHTAQKEQKDDGMGWIIWGWLLFTASVLTYINLKTDWFNPFFFWNLFGIASVLLLVYTTVKNLARKTRRVRTYTGDLFDKLNIGFFVFLILIIFSINVGVPPTKGFALLMGLYAFWMLIYGTAIDFKPSVIAAYFSFGLAFGALYVPDFGWTMILHGGVALFGYIIPGHMANSEFKKVKNLKERF